MVRTFRGEETISIGEILGQRAHKSMHLLPFHLVGSCPVPTRFLRCVLRKVGTSPEVGNSLKSPKNNPALAVNTVGFTQFSNRIKSHKLVWGDVNVDKPSPSQPNTNDLNRKRRRERGREDQRAQSRRLLQETLQIPRLRCQKSEKSHFWGPQKNGKKKPGGVHLPGRG